MNPCGGEFWGGIQGRLVSGIGADPAKREWASGPLK
jgi:hypothetical protein